jgi:hypothetical protein
MLVGRTFRSRMPTRLPTPEASAVIHSRTGTAQPRTISRNSAATTTSIVKIAVVSPIAPPFHALAQAAWQAPPTSTTTSCLSSGGLSSIVMSSPQKK